LSPRIKEVLIISNPEFIEGYKSLFGDGEDLGMKIEYLEQDHPRGIADAFNIGKEFIDGEPVALILGDNIFYGQGFTPLLEEAVKLEDGALILGYYVNDPSEFGVVEFEDGGKVISLEEKPKEPRSNYAIPGLYFYDGDVCNLVKNMEPSARGELEITDLNRLYLEMGKLRMRRLGRGFAWLDTGTYGGLADASNFVETIQKMTGLYVGCIEEIAYHNGFISREKLMELGRRYDKTDYGQYLLRVAGE
jgi:glucose-1-phosphate thymidylyltransferase